MLNQPRLRLAFLGCGWATRLHSRTLALVGNVELRYASRDGERAGAYCRHFAGQRAYESYDAALDDETVDIVVIATPTATHRDLTIRALSAGKDVIVEKPAFMRSDDVDIVQNVASEATRRVFVAENYFYKPVALHIRQLIERGDLGDVRFVILNATKRQTARDWRADPSLSGGGALFEAGVHWINFAANLGLEVIGARGYRVGTPYGPDRSSLVVFRYANGAVGTLAHSWELAAPLGGLRLSKVQGTHGAVTFESNGFAYLVSTNRRTIRFPIFRDALGYRAMFEDFFRAQRHSTVPQFTLEMARRDLVLLEAAQATMAEEMADM